MMAFMRGRGGQGGPGGNAPSTPVQAAREDLNKTLDNKDASADDIKAKLTALRDAETKAEGDLDKARQELKELLTQRQEAVLVMDGILK
jgi:septal ring factor EnvC (AmiA/AmiB activator)